MNMPMLATAIPSSPGICSPRLPVRFLRLFAVDEEHSPTNNADARNGQEDPLGLRGRYNN